jgi:hypothetical protein
MIIPKPMKFDVKTNDKTKKSQDNAKPNKIGTTTAQSTQRKTLKEIFFFFFVIFVSSW